MRHFLIVTSALTALLAACGDHTAPTEVGGPSAAVVATNHAVDANRKPGTTVIVYDDFQKPGAANHTEYFALFGFAVISAQGSYLAITNDQLGSLLLPAGTLAELRTQLQAFLTDSIRSPRPSRIT